MKLRLNGRLIITPMDQIVNTIKKELTNGKLKDIVHKHDNIVVSCPHHKDGLERNASCSVYCGDSDKTEYGTCHCFTCGFTGPLYHFIASCFDKDDEFGKQWLLEHFGDVYFQEQLVLPTIDISKDNVVNKLDENILNQFQSYHPYMTKRKLTNKVIDMFKIKFDQKTNCIVFPVWDDMNNLVMLTRRSVVDKTFIIDEGIEKPVYLLNYVRNLNIKSVYVCESQINALTLWGYGIPAIALLGTGGKQQYNILNKSGIRCYTLCFDGDLAGDKGIVKFKKNIRKDVLINVCKIPRGTDVNELSEEEFFNLTIV